MEILKIADIGIQDVCLHKEYLASNDDIKNRKTINLPLELNLKIEVDKLEQRKRSYRKKEVYLLRNSNFHSEETKKLFLYLGWIIAALDQKRVILLMNLILNFIY